MSRSRHTIAHYIWLSGGTKYKHFSQFYCFFSRAFLSLVDQLWKALLLLLDQLLADGALIELHVDDTVRKKSGRKIQGASHYKNQAGSARQEYRSLWGLNFVYVSACFVWTKAGADFRLNIPLGLRIYLKESVALQLERPFVCRSDLAREMIDFIAHFLAHRQFLVKADGGYSTKAFLRNRPDNVELVGRLLITGRLYEAPPKAGNKKKKAGRPPVKGKDLGTPQEWIEDQEGWSPHPDEDGALIKTMTGIWHSVLPGVLIKVVVVWRKQGRPANKRSHKKELEAFFTTLITFTPQELLRHYARRWAVEIDIRDAYAYYGFGKDQCRNLDRIYGVNTFRLLMAACRTLWFIQYFQKRPLALKNFRPWYRKKCHPTQLDIIAAAQEAFLLEGVSPVPRFIMGSDEITPPRKEFFEEAA
jgi:hypothetical protein